MPIAAAIVGGAVIGGIAMNSAADTAASAQTDAANKASSVQQAQYQQTRNDLLPYNQSGQAALGLVNNLLGTGSGGSTGSSNPAATNSPDWNAYLAANPDVQNAYDALDPSVKSQFANAQAYAQYHYSNYGQKEGRALPTTATGPGASSSASTGGLTPQNYLTQTPGYQFTLSQGLRGVANSAAARGLGVSGAAFKGATNYAGGVANQTYGDQINRLMSVASLGENAGAQTGNYGTATASSIGNNITSAGNAQSAASIASGNALTGAASSIPNALITSQLLGKSGGIYADPNTAWSGGPPSYLYGG